jgi:uncharacterized protein YndB with AHSA1/START domain
MTSLPFRLERSIVIHAEPGIVFRFFQDTDRWASWWGAGSTIDSQPQGRVLIRHAEGVDVVGEVIDVEPPGKIVFSYGFLDRKAEPAGDSRVTICLEALGESTRLHLTHEFADAAARDEHDHGWRFQLSIFANVVANEVHASVAQAIDTWFSAWSMSDPILRKDAFASVSAIDVGLRDRFSLIDGLDDLVAHTAAYQKFFPGIRFERQGEVRHCQGVVLADWVTDANEGTPLLKGTCCFTFNTSNQIEGAINFISSSNDKTGKA